MKKFIFVVILSLMGAAACSAFAAKPKVKTETVTYQVNMHCKNCENKLTDKLSFIKGVTDCQVSLKEKTVKIVYDPAKVKESTFVEVIEKLGYTAQKTETSLFPRPFEGSGIVSEME